MLPAHSVVRRANGRVGDWRNLRRPRVSLLIAGVHQIWTWRDGVLFLHECGIRRRRAGQESVVRFDQVAEMKYQSTRVFVNGSYGGTIENLSVRTRNPTAGGSIFAPAGGENRFGYRLRGDQQGRSRGTQHL